VVGVVLTGSDIILLTSSETIGGLGSSLRVGYIGIGGGGGIKNPPGALKFLPPLIRRVISSVGLLTY
jgi:hypothetical protein